MKEDTNQNKKARKPIPLTLETIEKIRGDGPSFQDYVDSLSQEDLDRHRSQYMATKENFTLGFDERKFKIPDFDWLDLSLAQVKALTDDELQKLLSGEGHKGGIRDSTIQLISNEILMRQIKESSKPHWTTVPAFFLLVATLFLTAVPVAMIAYDLISKKTESSNNHTNQSKEVKPDSKP